MSNLTLTLPVYSRAKKTNHSAQHQTTTNNKLSWRFTDAYLYDTQWPYEQEPNIARLLKSKNNHPAWHQTTTNNKLACHFTDAYLHGPEWPHEQKTITGLR